MRPVCTTVMCAAMQHPTIWLRLLCRTKSVSPLPFNNHIERRSRLASHARYASSDQAILDSFTGTDAFGKLMKAAVEVANQQAEMPAADVAAMFIALAQFTGTVYPDRLDHVDYVLTSCYQAIPPVIALIAATFMTRARPFHHVNKHWSQWTGH